MIKEKDDPGSKNHSGKHSEKAEKGQKSESREVRKSHPSSPEVRKTCRGRMEDREREPRTEKSKHKHKSSSRREEREDRHRERDRGWSSDIHSRWHDRRSEGRHDRCSLRGVVTGVEVGTKINPTGTKGPGTPGTRSPLIPRSAGITDAAACSAIQHGRIKNELYFSNAMKFSYSFTIFTCKVSENEFFWSLEYNNHQESCSF